MAQAKKMLRVRAVGQAAVAFHDDEGHPLVGRDVGREALKPGEYLGDPIPEGELVEDTMHYKIHIMRGELEVVDDSASAQKVTV